MLWFVERLMHHLLIERLATLFELISKHNSSANHHGNSILAAMQPYSGCSSSSGRGKARPSGNGSFLQLHIHKFTDSPQAAAPALWQVLRHRRVRQILQPEGEWA